MGESAIARYSTCTSAHYQTPLPVHSTVRMAFRPRISILVLALLVLELASCQTCYDMMGAVAPDSAPCGSSKACCNYKNGDACLSSGLCYATNGNSPSLVYFGGGCTSKNGADDCGFSDFCGRSSTSSLAIFEFPAGASRYCADPSRQ